MKLSEAGANLMHQYEGYRTKPYLCPAHIWTIGYGHVLYQNQIRLPVVRVNGYTGLIRKEYALKPEDNRVWTKEEIEKLFADDIASFERGVLRLAPTVFGRQGAFDACVSFSFNAGLVDDKDADSVVDVIVKAASTGSIGDGKVWTIKCMY